MVLLLIVKPGSGSQDPPTPLDSPEVLTNGTRPSPKRPAASGICLVNVLAMIGKPKRKRGAAPLPASCAPPPFAAFPPRNLPTHTATNPQLCQECVETFFRKK